MKKEFWVHIAVLITGGVVWSVTAFAYMHNNFTTKDMFVLLLERANRIEVKLDYLIQKNNK